MKKYRPDPYLSLGQNKSEDPGSIFGQDGTFLSWFLI